MGISRGKLSHSIFSSGDRLIRRSIMYPLEVDVSSSHLLDRGKEDLLYLLHIKPLLKMLSNGSLIDMFFNTLKYVLGVEAFFKRGNR